MEEKNLLLKTPHRFNIMAKSVASYNHSFELLIKDLKRYRKDVGNFSCGLDGYESFEKKIWMYTEENKKERIQVFREHLQDTKERFEQTEERILSYKR